MKLTDLTVGQQEQIIRELAILAHIDVQSAEKDWWVTQVLKAIFSLPYAEHLSFKGGTSLSKCWHLINRKSFVIPKVVTPERTFLEKVCLLHEEFSKPENIRVSRMSRHLYDIVMMMQVGVAEKALDDRQLFQDIVEHRRKFINLKDFDYNTLAPHLLSIVPPIPIMELWQKDYDEMLRTMIYGDAPSFEQVITQIRDLETKFHDMN